MVIENYYNVPFQGPEILIVGAREKTTNTAFGWVKMSAFRCFVLPGENSSGICTVAAVGGALGEEDI